MNKYIPPFTISSKSLTLVAGIMEILGQISNTDSLSVNLKLRRTNRVKTIQATLAIESNTLSLEQVTAIVNGKNVLGAPNEIKEVQNAFLIYEKLLELNPYKAKDLLLAHKVLMSDLMKEVGCYRNGNVGVISGDNVVHVAPQPQLVPELMTQLIRWIKDTDVHPLIKGCVFHYEFEFIHPFADGNGRMGRLWHTLILSKWKPIFEWLPVETLIKERQQEYYNAISNSTNQGKSDVFVEFMLAVILDSLRELQKDYINSINFMSKQVQSLLEVLGDYPLSSKQLMERLHLRSRASFKKLYLDPALNLSLIEMTIPDKPNSKNQKYIKKLL